MVSRSTPADWISWIHAICKNRNVPFALYTQINALRLNLPGQEYSRGLDLWPNETQQALERGTGWPFLIWRLSWRHESSHHSVKETQEFDILKEHTKEFLAPLSDTSGTGHPRRHRNMQTQAPAGIRALAYPHHSALPFHRKLLWSHTPAKHSTEHLADASQLHKEAAQQERCLGDGTLGAQCLRVQQVCWEPGVCQKEGFIYCKPNTSWITNSQSGVSYAHQTGNWRCCVSAKMLASLTPMLVRVTGRLERYLSTGVQRWTLGSISFMFPLFVLRI